VNIEDTDNMIHGERSSLAKSKGTNGSVHKLETDNCLSLMPWPCNNKNTNPSPQTFGAPLPLDNASILVQCGSIDRSEFVAYRITNVPLQFCLTKLNEDDEQEVASLATLLGVPISKYFDVIHTTHVIGDRTKKEKTASVLCAMLKDIPIVSKDFFIDMAGRKSIHDPLPQVNDYAIFAGELDMPWEVSQSLSEKRKICMKGFKVISLLENEFEPLCVCCGATIVRLYESPSRETWNGDDWLEMILQEQEKDSLTVLWLDSKKASKAKSTVMNNLKRLKEERMHIPPRFQIYCVDPKAIAQRIKTLGTLKDIDGSDVFPDAIEHESDDMRQRFSSDNRGEEHTEMAARITDVPKEADDSNISSAQSTSRKRDSSHLTCPRIPQPKTKASGWISSQRVKGTAVEASSEIGMSQKKQKTDEKTQGEMTQASLNALNQETSDDSKDKLTSKQKRPLPMGKEKGWLRAAPTGKKRLLYMVSCEVADTAQEAAITEVRSDLIVRKIENAKENWSQQAKNVVDYKKFKKNPVIQGSKMLLSKVRLVSVAPAVSERFTQLEQLQKDEQKRQQEADILFAGIDNTMRGTQKQRGGGIRNYFN